MRLDRGIEERGIEEGLPVGVRIARGRRQEILLGLKMLPYRLVRFSEGRFETAAEVPVA